MTLTVVNLTGVDIEQKANYVTVNATGSPDPSESASPAPTVGCVFPPNVVGETLSNGKILLDDAGFNVPTQDTVVTSGPKGKIQGQNPDHTECVELDQQFQLVYRPN